MDGDVLLAILQALRRQLPAVPAEQWSGIEQHLRSELGGRQHYIARRSKGTHLARLEAAAEMDEQLTNAQLAQQLGISERRVQQLRQLTGRRRG